MSDFDQISFQQEPLPRRIGQRDILPYSLKARLGGKLVRVTNTVTVSNSVTFYSQDMVKYDPATYINDEEDITHIRLTPELGFITLSQDLTSIDISSATSQNKVVSDADDGTETNSATWSSTVLQWGKNASNQVLTAGVSFDKVFIPKTANITEAYLVFVTNGTRADDVNAKIYGTLNAYAADYASGNRPSQVVKTSASVDWDTTGQTDNEFIVSPDISTIVNELNDQANWTAGNRMQFQITDDGSASNNSYVVKDLNSDPGAPYVAYLEIIYDTPAATATFTSSPKSISVSGFPKLPEIPIEMTVNPEYAGTNDDTGVMIRSFLTRNKARFLDAATDSIRSYVLSYTIDNRVFLLDPKGG